MRSVNEVIHPVHQQYAEHNASRFLFGLQIWGCGDEIWRLRAALTKLPPLEGESVWFGFVAFREKIKREFSFFPLYIKIRNAWLLFFRHWFSVIVSNLGVLLVWPD